MEEQNSRGSYHFFARNNTGPAPISSGTSVLRTSSTETLPPKQIRILFIEQILFTQRSVNDHFSDGKSLKETVSQLVKQEIQPDDLPIIRVVFHNNRWYSLDNRRLRVFKDAAIEKVKVEVCSLQNTKIKTEFELKKSNKSVEGGGMLRSVLRAASVNVAHFDQGAFTFTKIVLNWNFTQIATPLSRLQRKQALTDQFFSTLEYFDAFKDFILEEARAILQQGLEIADKIEVPFLMAPLAKTKWAKTFDNPSTLKFALPLPSKQIDWSPKPGDMVLLKIDHLQFTGMVAYLSKDERHKKLAIKTVIDEETRQKHGPFFLSAQENWQLISLGSLITQMRMYDVCCERPEGNLTNMFLRGEATPVKSVLNLSDNLEEEILLEFAEDDQEGSTGLNPSQSKAIEHFVHLKQGVQLVQGPPGTGKTSTIINLLKILTTKTPPERILVSAPSNKAVQLLAEKFILACPKIACVLAGVEDKLPEDNINLEKIFLHTWQKNLVAHLSEMAETLRENHQKFKKFTPQQRCEEEKLAMPAENKLNKKMLNKAGQEIANIKEIFQTSMQSVHFYSLNVFGAEVTFKEDEKAFLTNLDAYYSVISSLKAGAEITLTQNQQLNLHVGNLLGLLTGWQLKLNQFDNEALEKMILNNAVVIFATLSVCGRKSMKEMNSVDALIIDEAGQAVEAECLVPLLAKPKKCLLVGDTKQLPATVISTEAVRFKYDRSLIYRLLEDCKQPYHLLNVQYRMHPEISCWPNQRYYQQSLRDAASVQEKKHLPTHLQKAPSFLCPYAFINIVSTENKNKTSRSYYNVAEAQAIEKILAYLAKKCAINIEKQVGIVTFYKAQVFYLQRQLSKNYPKITIKSVDGFQGGENDITVLSFVRANPNHTIGFVKDGRRLNVALTRAKFSTIIVGNAETLARSKNPDLQALVHDAKTRKKYFNYEEIVAHLNIFLPAKKSQKSMYQKQTIKHRTSLMFVPKNPALEPPTKNHVPKIEKAITEKPPKSATFSKRKNTVKPTEEKKLTISHVPKISSQPATSQRNNPSQSNFFKSTSNSAKKNSQEKSAAKKTSYYKRKGQ